MLDVIVNTKRMGAAAPILPACPLLPTLLRSLILLSSRLGQAPPRLEAQLGKGQKEHLEEQQTRAREAKARAQATGKPGAEPYGVTWTRKLNTMLSHRYSEI